MQATKKTVTERTLRTGWAESRVIAVNPTADELEKIGIAAEEEPNYQKEKDGETITWIDFWMEELKTGYKYKRTFFLQDTPAKTSPKEDQKDFVEKTQYVNQIGDNAWAVNKKELKEGFLKFRKKVKGSDEYEIGGDKVFRVAKKGEADLMTFIKMWMSGCDFRDEETNILLDMKKIFNGNFKEIKEQVDGEFTTSDRNGKEYPSTIVDLLEVKTVVKDGEPRDYQSVWRRPIAGWMMKTIRNTKFTKENIAKWKADNDKMAEWNKAGKKGKSPEGARWLKDYEKLAVEISTGEHRSKNFYSLELAHEYDPNQNFVSSGAAVTTEGSDVSDTDDDY